MQHNLRRTSFGPIQCWKQASTAERTSASVAKYRLCSARRLVSFQTRSIGASCGLYGGRNSNVRCRLYLRSSGLSMVAWWYLALSSTTTMRLPRRRWRSSWRRKDTNVSVMEPGRMPFPAAWIALYEISHPGKTAMCRSRRRSTPGLFRRIGLCRSPPVQRAWSPRGLPHRVEPRLHCRRSVLGALDFGANALTHHVTSSSIKGGAVIEFLELIAAGRRASDRGGTGQRFDPSCH
jgi:hypothetical protein